jgi:asparagine synthase (glutamine-hydrolysing)
MCGLAGVLCGEGAPTRDALDPDVIAAMAAVLRHRGPDDAGVWIDPDAGIALGHRRLSVIDLSPHGHQPMHSADDRYVIAYNGEIYNCVDLGRELAALGHRFRGHSDTEVLLAALTQWGLDRTLERVNGMFAFALWDRLEARLHLVRDRLGKKPLYYGWAGTSLVFGSELKALLAHPGFVAGVNVDALALFLRHGYVPAPWCMLERTFKLVAGTRVQFDARIVAACPSTHDPRRAARSYWNPAERATEAIRHPFPGTQDEACEQLDNLLRDAVRRRMQADVPLGAFLSGGTDSSLVTALMQAQSPRPVLTFAVGFDDPRHDESTFARRVAAHLGTEHTEIMVTAKEALAVVPDLAAMFDEPFADSSQIPTALVAALARRRVTVALSGDGGDELFGGYTRYLRALQLWRWHERCPVAARHYLTRVIASRATGEARGGYLTRLADELQAETLEAMYLNRVSRWRNPARAVPGAVEPDTVFTRPELSLHDGTAVDRMLFLDACSYLPDDILAKVDRTSMAVSLEARTPLLDHRVVEFAWSLPTDMKIRGDTGKWILKRLLHRYVPAALVERPKRGFGAPVGDWLNGPLAAWAESLLAADRLERAGYFDVQVVRSIWREFRAGHRKWHTHLWSILMFEAWRDWLAQPRVVADATMLRRQLPTGA